MIISHKNKFTLMRVPKTGSTSLEASVRFCGAVHEDDICSKTEDAHLPVQNIPFSYKEEVQHHMQLLKIAKTKQSYKFKLTEEEQQRIDYPHKWMFFMEHNTLDDWFKIPCFSKLNLISKEQVHEYKHYGFLRDPVERYLSAFVFYQVWSGRGKQKPITVQEFHKFTLTELKKHDNILFRPQKEYFYFEGKQIVEPMLFNNWSSEASRMIKEVGFHPLSVYPRFKEDGGAKKRLNNNKPQVADWVDSYANIKDYISDHFREDIEFYKKYI
jgi:hypothetical protein